MKNWFIRLFPNKIDPTYMSAGGFEIKFPKYVGDYSEKRLIFQLEREFGARVTREQSTAEGYSPYERALVFSYSARDLNQKFKIIRKWMKLYKNELGKYDISIYRY
jgi:hypothetical protein